MDARPQRLDQMVLTPTVRSLLESVCEPRRLTSLLFHGGPGVGKTSAIECICMTLQEKVEGFRRNRDVLSLNASDDRGLDTVRTTMSAFVQHAHENGTIKVLVLDEIDAMMLPAQRTLATLLSKSPAILFATCNYLCRVDQSLRDLCILIEMPSPNEEEAIMRLVAQTGIEKEAASRIYDDTNGDLRTARNYCGLAAGLTPEVRSNIDFLTPELRLDRYLVDLCENEAAKLAASPELLSECEELLLSTQVSVRCRWRALREIRTELKKDREDSQN